MHGALDKAFLVEANRHIDHALVENFDFGFDIALDHAFAEILDGVFGVNKDVVPAEIAGAAVEGCHFGHKLDGLEPFVIAHADCTAGGGLNDNIGTFCIDGIHAFFEACLILGGCAVIIADMQVNDACARFVCGIGFVRNLFNRVRHGGIVFLGDFRAADAGGDDEFFHGFR